MRNDHADSAKFIGILAHITSTYPKRDVAVVAKIQLAYDVWLRDQRAYGPQRVAQRGVVDRVNRHAPRMRAKAMRTNRETFSFKAQFGKVVSLSVPQHVALPVVDDSRRYHAVELADVQRMFFVAPCHTARKLCEGIRHLKP